VEIELRQHRDGSYVLEVRAATGTQEIDVSGVIREIFLDKLRELQARVRLEEKYRNWVVDTAQQNQSTLASALTRYSAVVERLNQTNESILTVVDSWRKQKDLILPMKRVTDLISQNQHFVKNDPLLRMIEELKKEEK